MATALPLGPSYLVDSSRNHNPSNCRLGPGGYLKKSYASVISKRVQIQSKDHKGRRSTHKFTILAVTEGSTNSSKSEETVPSWARPESDEPPPWARGEGKETSQQTIEVPFYAYLLASTVTAIAAIGSIFEFIYQRPVFGVLYPDSVFYVPLLGFFTVTGIPTSAFLWFKSVQAANKAADEQDRKDGYR